MTAAALSQKLRSSASVVVVDTRDSDHAGGHIRGSVHVPARDFKRDVTRYARAWAAEHLVVFHCMMSQVRGPSCAAAFAEAVGKARAEQGEGPKVAVLQGGFIEFAKLYSEENRDLFEDFEPALYGQGWEHD